MRNSCRYSSVFLPSLSFITCFLQTLLVSSNTADSITQGQLIKNGDTIISKNKNFALGFFSPEDSAKWYLGIWYYKISIQTVVWVANRENPGSGSGGVLTIGQDGNLMVLDGNRKLLWSTNVSDPSNNSTAVLMDNGNLELRCNEHIRSSDKILWQSFEHPTDTFLPGMRIGANLKTGGSRGLRSWRSPNDPSIGNFYLGVDPDPRGSDQIIVWEKDKKHWRSGRWDGQLFTGVPGSSMPAYPYGFSFVHDQKSGMVFFLYNSYNTSNFLRFRIRWDGSHERLDWDEEGKQWTRIWLLPNQECNYYNKCGAFGSCSMSNPTICYCLKGFEPKIINEWNERNWTHGCLRRTQLECQRNVSSFEEVNGDGFLKLEGVKLPDYSDVIPMKNRGECERACSRNCSCKAFAHVSGIGCLVWAQDLVDIKEFKNGGEDLYIRVARSELGGKSKLAEYIVIILSIVGVIFLCTVSYLLWRYTMKDMLRDWKHQRSIFGSSKRGELTSFSRSEDTEVQGNQRNVPQVLSFNFNSILASTNRFSDINKLGEGGFGAVYKGKLPSGLEIAVKRLSRGSGQGIEEFKTEIMLIAKLQHRNLVRLLGFCIQGDEKMLIYEFMPNNSLDAFIFDKGRQHLLDWRTRFNIIEGIARGLLYLHRDSRLRIIHRDLKAANILLDEEMNPKISDFGMAKIFGGNQRQANTKRIVGTYGYMSPEYAMEGLFSEKSDVYSFGVLLLEIVFDQRISHFYHFEYSMNLLSYAWKLWSENKAMEFIDQSIHTGISTCEVMRCIAVGLLCVQDSAADRPTMASVLLMLDNQTANLPAPKQPTYTKWRNHKEMDQCIDSPETVASNEVTITEVVGR